MSAEAWAASEAGAALEAAAVLETGEGGEGGVLASIGEQVVSSNTVVSAI